MQHLQQPKNYIELFQIDNRDKSKKIPTTTAFCLQ
jgi:hypothetical protein